MPILYILCLATILSPLSSFAQSFAERMNQTYLQTDKKYDVDCYYSYNKTLKLISPLGQTVKEPNKLSRSFQIEGNGTQIPMTFTLNRSPKGFDYEVILDNKHRSASKLKYRNFYIAPIEDQTFASEFETSKIYCKVNIAYELPFVLTDGTYHFSVHPHKLYDWQSRLKGPIENYLNDSNFRSVIFLETTNYRGDLVNLHQFFDGTAYTLPQKNYDSDLENVPFDVPLVVSPAGNNRFDVTAESQVNITFTGGNHNYCIWNVTRHVIENLMNSKSEAKVNFFYDLNSIVAQSRGIEGEGLEIDFNKRDVNRSNLLKDLLSKKEVQAKYHASYIEYFRDFIGRQFSGMYKTYKINYKAEGYEMTVVLEGQGTRDLEFNFSYID